MKYEFDRNFHVAALNSNIASSLLSFFWRRIKRGRNVRVAAVIDIFIILIRMFLEFGTLKLHLLFLGNCTISNFQQEILSMLVLIFLSCYEK
jgi:hypothetical protein